jgi:hypothetical protein
MIARVSGTQSFKPLKPADGIQGLLAERLEGKTWPKNGAVPQKRKSSPTKNISRKNPPSSVMFPSSQRPKQR